MCSTGGETSLGQTALGVKARPVIAANGDTVVTCKCDNDGALRQGHAEKTARRTAGLEAVLIDYDQLEVVSLDLNDGRSMSVRVVGPAALLIAKLHKIAERAAELAGAPQRRNRLNDKDAADIYRLFQATPVDVLAAGFRLTAQEPVSAEATAQAKEFLVRLFGRRGALGIDMATRSLSGAVPADTIAAVSQSYVADLISRVVKESTIGHLLAPALGTSWLQIGDPRLLSATCRGRTDNLLPHAAAALRLGGISSASLRASLQMADACRQTRSAR